MNPDHPTATRTARTFRMSCRIHTRIQASPATIWALLTDAAAFPRWNSTVSHIEGEIALGQRLQLTVPAAPGRTFTPRVTHVDTERSMIWSDGLAPVFRGVRTFTLTPGDDGTTEFTMEEEFVGVMLPMIKRSMPDLGPVFEAYAADLKRAAEAASA